MRCDRIPPSRLMYETAAVLSVQTSTCLPNSSGRNCRKAKCTAHSSRQLMCQSSRGRCAGPAAEQKRKILLPALHQGKERRCSRRLLRKSKFQHLRVARIRAASSTSWTTWGLAGTRGGGALLREARRAGQGIDSAWGGAALEDAGGCPRRRAD